MDSKADDIVGLFALSIILFSVEGLGFLILVMTAALFAGQVIGENDILLASYVIGAMTFSYLIPIILILTFRLKNIGQAVFVLIIASIIFAVPSSFVTEGGCKAGNENAMWAMRAVPIWWLGDTIFTPNDGHLTCHDWTGIP